MSASGNTLRKLLVASAALALLGAYAALPAPSASGAETRVRAVVQSDDPATLKTLKEEYGVKHDFGDLGFSANLTPSELTEIDRKPGVEARQAYEYSPPVVETAEIEAVQEEKEYARPGFTPLNIERVHAPAAWDEGVTGDGVGIAFIDTGLDVEHPDFEGAVFLCVDATTSTFSLTDTTIREIREECPDYVGHGTHVAGTGAANGGSDGGGILGVARAAGIGMARVCPGFICLEDDIAAGILLAAERGADVLSISLGGSEPSPFVHAAIKSVIGEGVVVVASAGNSGPDPDTIGYPAAFPEVIAVAATEHLVEDPDTEDEIFSRVTDFSSRGIDDGNDRKISEREVELATPGRSIFSTCDGAFDGEDTEVDGYCVLSGTSMAAPHVGGIVALIIHARGGEATMEDASDVQEVRDIWISNTGKTTFDITEDCCGHATTGYDIASGYGMPEMDLVLDFLEGPGQGGGTPAEPPRP